MLSSLWTMMSILFFGGLLIFGFMLYKSSNDWDDMCKKAIEKDECPFCGTGLRSYTDYWTGKELTTYYCPHCDFATKDEWRIRIYD